MKNNSFSEALVVGAVVILSASLVSGCGPEPEPGATTTIAEREIPGMHTPGDINPVTARVWVHGVEVGRALDVKGRVPPENRSETFSPKDDVFISMEVTDAPVGSVVRLSIHDATHKAVWTQEKTVPADRAYLSFRINGGTLSSGEYQADVLVGDERVANQRLSVISDTSA